jgi:hypothetical protein
MTSALILPPIDKRSAILRARAPFARPRFLEPIAPNLFSLTYGRTSSKLFQKCARVADLL